MSYQMMEQKCSLHLKKEVFSVKFPYLIFLVRLLYLTFKISGFSNRLGSKTGNRRTANIRSVGYSDLFCLTKQDLWEVLAEYPSARDTLIERGKAHLRKDNLLDEEAAQMAQQDEAAIPEKVTRLEGNIDNLEIRLARLIGEYTASMASLGKRLQVVEKLAEKRQESSTDDQRREQDTFHIRINEDDV